MIAFDAHFVMLALRPSIPTSVDHAKQRVTNLVTELQKAGERIVVPTPALTEFLVHADAAGSRYLDELQKSSRFKIAPFGLRASVDVAVAIEAAIKRGNKRDGSKDTWAKVNFDRQIAAIAKVEGAHTLYTNDANLKTFAEKMGLKVIALDELPVPPSKFPLLDALDELLLAPPIESEQHEQTVKTANENDELQADPPHSPSFQGSDDRRAEGETPAETAGKISETPAPKVEASVPSAPKPPAP